MGQAKRRKDLGLMPEPSQKPRKTARARVDHPSMFTGIGDIAMLMSSILMRRRMGEAFAIRNEMAQTNREEEETA